MKAQCKTAETPTKNSVFIDSWKLPLLIFVLAAFLRLWGAFDLNEYLEDEAIQVPNAISLGTYGTTENWHWHHPHAGYLLMYSTIKMFGNNPVGWRSSNVMCGTLSVVLIFMVARLLYPKTAVPVISAALLAFDPYHIYLSRNTYTEIPVTFFFLLYLYLALEYTENKKATLPLAGIAMGFTMATKGYFVLAIPLVILFVLFRIRQQQGFNRHTIFDCIASLVLLPVAIYLLSYIQWFSRGYTLPEFINMKLDALWELKTITTNRFVNHTALEASGKPWEWFLKPIFWGHQRLINSEEGRFLFHSNNIPFRLLVLPSITATSIYAIKNRLSTQILVPMLFISCYLLLILAQRPMFSYSSIPLLPFAYISVAFAVITSCKKIAKEQYVYSSFLVLIILWVIYMFPLISGQAVSLERVRPLISIARYIGTF